MNERELLRGLLEVELNNFAARLGLISDEKREPSYSLMVEALNLLKELSNREANDFNGQMAIMIVALLWSHTKNSWKDSLRQIITPVLSSMGFSPSNLMLDQMLKAEGIYSPIQSYFDKLKIVTHDLKNELIVKETPYLLTGFQASLWEEIEKNRLIGISAPTSAGKSFLIYLKIVDLVSRGGKRIVYVVPTLSLINQVTADLTKLLRQHGITDISVLNSFEEEETNFIYVVTQERAIILFSEQGVAYLDLLVVDEVQNLEKVANEGENRPKILYDVLMDVRNDVEVKKIILSGPRLRNIGNLGFSIFGETSAEKTTDAPPVLSLTYSISQQKSKHFLNQYSAIFDVPIQLEIKNDKIIQGLGQVQYTDNFNEYLHHVLSQLSGEMNIVFSPTSIQARKSAFAYSKFRELRKRNDVTECSSLADYFRNSVHPKYKLADMVEQGIAYHTGKTPMHVRKSIEYATSKKWVDTLFCTTTLMQGVNLPANNIVIRNPNLFTKRHERTNASLSAYEFANLRGRAGRLLNDFIGRTIVLDEGAFSTTNSPNEGNSMFPEEYKEITTGYQDIYDNNAELVDAALAGSAVDDDALPKNLVTYIRQVLFRHGMEGESRLKNVGLYINKELLTSSLRSFSDIQVNREIILANRYWDPLDLNNLYIIFSKSTTRFPTNVFAKGLGKSLLRWSRVMQEHFPFYFNRYLKEGMIEKYLYGVAMSAENWAREKPLNEILIDRFGIGGEEIDDQIDSEIEKLTKYVSFGLPMLLKPLADMQNKESSIISSIELGVYYPLSKYLLDRGVPRETAIKVRSLHPSSADIIDKKLIQSRLNPWEQQHLEHIF